MGSVSEFNKVLTKQLYSNHEVSNFSCCGHRLHCPGQRSELLPTARWQRSTRIRLQGVGNIMYQNYKRWRANTTECFCSGDLCNSSTRSTGLNSAILALTSILATVVFRMH